MWSLQICLREFYSRDRCTKGTFFVDKKKKSKLYSYPKTVCSMSRSKRLLRKLYFKENENSSSVACKNGSQMRSFSHTMSKNRIARWWRNLPPPLHQLCVVFQNSRKFHTHDVYSCFRVDGLFFFFFFLFNKQYTISADLI